MRILYIITQGECGGAQKHVFDLAMCMHKIGHRVFVATGQHESTSDSWLFDNLKQSGFKDSQLFILKELQREIRFKKDIKSFYYIYRLVKTLNPHIVHTHSTKAGIITSIVAKIAGSVVVYTVHGFVFSESISIIKKIFFIIAEFIASFFRDQTVVVSDFDLNQGRRYKILKNKKSVLIYNGLDENISENILDRESARKIIYLKTGTIKKQATIIGVVANLYKTKGIEYLIEAAKKIHLNQKLMPYFIVIGEGELRRELEKKIVSYELSKYFFLVGAIPQAYRLLKAFDFIVLPSTKEGLPYIILEATAAGVPILATRVGGIIELSKHMPVSLVNPADSQSLAEKIVSMINFIKIPEAYGEKLAEKFTTKYMTNAILFEYEKIMGRSLQISVCKSFLLTLPVFNEEKIIGKTLIDAHQYLTREFSDLINAGRLKCCVAINGTTDKTEQIVTKIISAIPYFTYTVTKKRGRGIALFNTWRNATEDIFLYTDSDLAYSLEDIGSMIKYHLSNENYDLVVASRRLKDSFVKRHFLRKIITEFYNYLIKLLFWNSFTDAQAGCKSITNIAFSSIKGNMSVYPGFFFDTALLLYAEKNKEKIKDIAITCIDNRRWRLNIIITIMYFLKNIFMLRIKTFLYTWNNKK